MWDGAGAGATPRGTMSDRRDPSRVARVASAEHAARAIGAFGALARHTAQSATSPVLRAAITTFAQYETTIESTSQMLQKINQGIVDLDEAVEECAASLTR